MNLSDFYSEFETREFLRRPFNLAGYSLASDGHRLLRTKLQPHFDACPDAFSERMLELLAELDSLDHDLMRPLPEIEWPEKADCIDCSGVGSFDLNLCHECKGEKKLVFTSPHNTYSVTCKSCEGRGELEGLPLTRPCESCNGSGKGKSYSGTVWVEGVKMFADYVAPLAEDDSIVVLPSLDGMKLYFMASNGDSGLIFGMRKE